MERSGTWPLDRWLLFHCLAAALTALVWMSDESVFRVVNAWYNAPEPLNGELHQLVLSLAMYGQALGIVVAIGLIWLLDPKRRGRTVYVGAALIAVGLGSSTVKTLVGRDRPIDGGGKTVIHGPTKGITQSRHQSFPSGHTATAFALTVCLTRFYPRLAPMAWAAALGVGFNRIITVRHFPSDVVAAGWIGFALAHGVFRVGWLALLAERANALLEPNSSWQSTLRQRLSCLQPVQWRRRAWQAATSVWFLVVVSLAVNLVGNAATPLWDRDEPRFATATREMIERGDWIVPTFNGELRTDKPILIYWLMRAAYAAFGDNPFAARLVSSVAGTAACVLTVWFGALMFGRRAGLVAGWMLALSPMLVIESKLATVDAVLLAELTCCQLLLWRIIAAPHRLDRRMALAFWFVLGLAVLTKGPVALAILGATIVGYCLLQRDRSWLGRMEWLRGAAVLAAVVLPWALAVQVRTGGAFLSHSIGHHVVSRSLTPLENHRGFPGYYAASVLCLMAPWGLLLPFAIAAGWRWPRHDARFAFLAAWALGTLLLFEAVRTKLVHYFLPAYPALALWLAALMLERRHSMWRFRRWLTAFAACARVGGAVLTAAAVLGALTAFGRNTQAAVAVVGILFGGGICVAGELLARRRPRYAFVAAAASMAACWIVAGAWLVPAAGAARLTVQLAERLDAERLRGKPVALWQFREPSIIYNLQGPVKVVDPMRTEPNLAESIAFAQSTGGFVCPMTADDMRKMQSDPALRLRVVDELAGMDVTGCRCRTISLVEIQPARTDVAEMPRPERPR